MFKYDYGSGFMPINPCETTQKSIMSVVYDGLGQQFYQRDPVCEWTGITCDDNEIVTDVNLG